LKLYHPKIWNKLSSRLADLFLDLSIVSSKDMEFEQAPNLNQKDRDEQREKKRNKIDN
jgi:hypothetical protein